MPQWPIDLRGVGERIVDVLPAQLGDRLTGIYLYGSALDEDAYVLHRSDLDLIVVTESALDDGDFERLATWVRGELERDPTFERVQMTLLVRDRVLDDDPTACLVQHGELTRSGSDGNPIIWLDFLGRGRVLFGAEPDEFLPRITDDQLARALVREVGYLRAEFSSAESAWRGRSSYQAYAILTLCRILYSHATGEVTTKTAAAAWVKRSHPDDVELIQLVEVAEGVIGQHWIARFSTDAIEAFITRVESELHVG